MEDELIVLSDDLSDVKDLCRICLTKSKQIVSLYDNLEKQAEPSVSLIYDALCRVMTTEVRTLRKLYFSCLTVIN